VDPFMLPPIHCVVDFRYRNALGGKAKGMRVIPPSASALNESELVTHRHHQDGAVQRGFVLAHVGAQIGLTTREGHSLADQ